jgi:hypothetical protein
MHQTEHPKFLEFQFQCTDPNRNAHDGAQSNGGGCGVLEKGSSKKLLRKENQTALSETAKPTRNEQQPHENLQSTILIG